MSVTAFKALSIVRNSQTRSGPCLKIFKRNYSNNPKPSESGLKVPESESHVNPLSSLGKMSYYITYDFLIIDS